MIDLNMRFQKYAPLWNKYRPAILNMMIAASNEPQHYKLMKHEFHALDEKKRTSFGFNLLVTGSRAVNSIKDSETAQDLLIMLRLSRKGSQLLSDCTYEIILDNQFMLHISQIEPKPGTRQRYTSLSL